MSVMHYSCVPTPIPPESTGKNPVPSGEMSIYLIIYKLLVEEHQK